MFHESLLSEMISFFVKPFLLYTSPDDYNCTPKVENVGVPETFGGYRSSGVLRLTIFSSDYPLFPPVIPDVTPPSKPASHSPSKPPNSGKHQHRCKVPPDFLRDPFCDVLYNHKLNGCTNTTIIAQLKRQRSRHTRQTLYGALTCHAASRAIPAHRSGTRRAAAPAASAAA